MLSELMHASLREKFLEPSERSWFKLYKTVEAGGSGPASGVVSYEEFCRIVEQAYAAAAPTPTPTLSLSLSPPPLTPTLCMVTALRLGLTLPSQELQLLLSSDREAHEMALLGVWLALDRDGSGHISVGDFGAFMRKGEPHKGKAGGNWLEARAQRRAAQAAKARHTNLLRKRWRLEEVQRQQMQMSARVKQARCGTLNVASSLAPSLTLSLALALPLALTLGLNSVPNPVPKPGPSPYP